MDFDPSSLAALAFLLVNVVSFGAFGLDKLRARAGASRVPERTLHALSLLGGFAGGAIGIALFRHKSRKPSFLVVFALAAILSVAAWLAIARVVR